MLIKDDLVPNRLTLGSLFDGSGGFPLAGALCGVTPIWASEVEPYPIAVTKTRIPSMKHLGDISKINGAEIEPVDIITFGSPCQDLSVAGKRAGLKHEDNGDEETTRSGLFMEAVRIIKEMRKATNGVYPRFALWENVPGAFSSNKGEDFRIVLEELIKIAEPTAVMPSVPTKGWAYADSYIGDGWSLAYRVFDAQYWGVPQRRRRIHLVADFRGECARKVLFEREGLRGYFAEGGTPWKGITPDVERGIGANDREGNSIAAATQQGGAEITDNGVCPTITAAAGMSGNNQPWIATYDARGNGDGKTVNSIVGDHNNRVTDYTALVVEPNGCYWDGTQTVGTLTANNAGGNQRMPDKENFNCVIECKPLGLGIQSSAGIGALSEDVMPCLINGDNPGWQNGVCHEQPIVLDRAFYNQGQNALYEPQLYTDGIVPPIIAKGPSDVQIRYIVRRLTPTECARLQGFADRWGDIPTKTELSEEEYRFWLDVRNTHAAINGKQTKDYTPKQMLTWYNKLQTDSAEYKMWGNGIALPPALYCMQGMAEVLYQQ